jgi:hypothetical protein
MREFARAFGASLALVWCEVRNGPTPAGQSSAGPLSSPFPSRRGTANGRNALKTYIQSAPELGGRPKRNFICSNNQRRFD